MFELCFNLNRIHDVGKAFLLRHPSKPVEHMPRKQIRVREQDVSYMTIEWKEAIRARRRAARRYRKTNSLENWELLRKLRNEATRLKRKAIKGYWKRKSEELKTNPQDFYKTFTPFLGSKSKCRDYSDIKLNINGQVSRDKEEIAEVFGEYFATIADGIGQVDGKKKDLNMNIDIQGNTVTPYKSIKLLGENIDCQLIFRDHISEVCKKSSQRVGVIMRLRNMIPTAAKLQLYKAAILPYVTY